MQNNFLPALQLQRATERSVGQRQRIYNERLKECGLTSTEGSNLYDIEYLRYIYRNINKMNACIRARHDLTVVEGQRRFGTGKYSFSQRIIKEWKSDYVNTSFRGNQRSTTFEDFKHSTSHNVYTSDNKIHCMYRSPQARSRLRDRRDDPASETRPSPSHPLGRNRQMPIL